nr:efflux RND transporter periplasmic adaptor subunit [Bradyrhizobium zhengyangense]
MNVKRAAKLLIGALVVLPAGYAAYHFRDDIKSLKLPFALPFMQAAEAEQGPAGMPPPRPPVAVKVAAAKAEDVPIYLTGIGTIQASNTVNVQSRVDGEIVQILFQEGQDVKQGDILAVIDPRPFQAQLDQQIAVRQKDQALLDGAQIDMERYDALIKTAAISRQIVDQQHALVEQYKAQVRNDEAQIEYARTQLGFTNIRAPIGGRLGIRLVDQGNYVRAVSPTTIVTVTQLQPISVIYTLAAVAVGQTRLSLGQAEAPVVALTADNSTELDKGTITLVDNQVDQASGTIKLKASFPNKALKLWPGNFANGRITVDTRKNAITAPAIAVRHGPRGDFVWVAKADDTAAFRPVTVGQIFDGRALIDKGLAKGERVVTDGYYRLENGARITIEGQTPTAKAQATTQPRSESRVD